MSIIPKHYARQLGEIFPVGTATITVATARVYLVPYQALFRHKVDRIIAYAQATQAGNYIAGIYYDNGDTPAGGAVLVQSASLAKGGTNQQQEITIATSQLRPGLYWLAIESDEATSVFLAHISTIVTYGGTLMGYRYDLGIYGALTDPCPAVTPISSLPWLGVRVSSVP